MRWLGSYAILLCLVLCGAARAAICPTPADPNVSAPGGVTLAIDPATMWRPRGGEVRFTVTQDSGDKRTISRVTVCFRWPGAASPPDPIASAGVRAIAAATAVQGTSTFAAMLPNLGDVGTWWPRRLFSWWDRAADGHVAETTAFAAVPLADMLVQIDFTDPAAKPVVLRQSVGVTSILYAYLSVFFLLGMLYLIAGRIGRGRQMVGGASRRVLWVILGSDGYPSLSQFQIMLWTLTVAASAVFVMILSGNLVDISSGTLSLLGIAGGAALLARVPTQNDTRTARKAARAPGQPPRWSDMVVIDGDVDVTRVQMLIFTLVSAAFVVIQIVSTYEIPEIPANFVLLMGLSNGVYATARRLPQPDSGG